MSEIPLKAARTVLVRTQATRGAHLAWRGARVGALLPDQRVFHTELTGVISGET